MATHSDTETPAIIAVMGSTGVGKSTFINTVTRNHTLPVSRALNSCTKEVQEVRLKWGDEQRPLLLVDTPGFGDSSMSDTDVLRIIAKYLVKSHMAGTKLTGVIYMHSIIDRKVEGSTRRIFRMFQELCGSRNLNQVVIATTWWDKVDAPLAVEREGQLCSDKTLFKPMLDLGATMVRHEMRHDHGFSSAQNILHYLLQYKTMDLKIQKQLVNEKRSLPVTNAGEVINHDLMQNARQCIDRLEAVQEELNSTKDGAMRRFLLEERKELQAEKKVIGKQIKNLSKSLNERSFFSRLLGL
ncbi:P-loop containing nucleoside triphosphate hydrolase protein [Rickenella mellea]|uniref:P-loop containing nucleoside triphosphate hydrolase protein n=1 Tax=Rickenella mellea TaxID=50990 RepID=A0A4Y7PHP7_9AGAM|nr:P-loop containing nucleoside triphosphate hydrolase protein [Rickenella mellea]